MLEKSVMLIGNSGKVQKRSLMNTLMQLRKIVRVVISKCFVNLLSDAYIYIMCFC